MKKIVFAMALALSVSAWTGAKAENRTWNDGSTLPEYLALYDVNGDGVLSIEEIQAMKNARKSRHEDWLALWDTNHDGVIDEAEKAAAQAAMQAKIEQTRIERFNEADIDGDGCLTFQEFTNIAAVAELAEEHPEEPARIYDQLDANDDQCVSLEEFTACIGHDREEWRTVETYNAADADTNGCLTVEEFSAIPRMVQLAQEHPEEPAHIYAELDADHDNCLTLAEFTADFDHEGPGGDDDHPDQWRTADTYAAADVNPADGCLTFDEFSAIPAVVAIAQEHPDVPAQIYARLDVDTNNCLTLAEFTADLDHEGSGGGDHPDDWRTADTYAAADVNPADGCLTFEEFSAIPQVADIAQEHPNDVVEMYGHLDANHDNCLSLAEFTANFEFDGGGHH